MNPEWVRKGECNHCGYCCQFMGGRLMAFEHKPISGEVDMEFLKMRGVSFRNDGKAEMWADLYVPCVNHDSEAKRCRIYDERPRTCHLFPQLPEQIIGTPCSYWFERGEEKIGGMGSPYPVEAIRTSG